ECPLRGYADIHLHLFGQMGHGGAVISGAAWDEDGVNAALAQDYGTDRPLVLRNGMDAPPPIFCPLYMGLDCGSHLFHGDHLLIDDPIGSDFGTRDGSHSPLGAPIFNGWPQWTSTTHQQAYYRWLERAWRGGLRLVTMLAVTNESLCRSQKRLAGVDCYDSMAAIDDQLDAAYSLQTAIDDEAGGEGQGWFRIVKSSDEARQAILHGKLAVVLGIEVDNLFNCRFPESQCMKNGGAIESCSFADDTGECTADSVRAAVDKYYEKGVRHVFPVHDFDNAFGGAATWQDAIDVGNRAVEGHWWKTEDCSADGYGFELGSLTQIVLNLFSFDDLDSPPGHPGTASCNSFGLLPLGKVLIAALMDKGMIIDVDHMLRKALSDTLDLTEARGYPVVASHVQFFDLNDPDIRHERMRTPDQLARIRDSGGMIGAMLKDDVQDAEKKGEKKTIAYGDKVDDTCRHSSRTWAQAYEYAVDTMGGPVAMGSDFNGIAGHVGPRFGSQACGGSDRERSAQERDSERLAYPFSVDAFGTFDEQVTGEKQFDFNVDGLAHVGLLPDLVADLKQV